MFWLTLKRNGSTVRLEFPGDDWVPVMERVGQELNPDYRDEARDRRFLEVMEERKKAASTGVESA